MADTPSQGADHAVTLREVTAGTVRAICALKAQPEGFVASNAVSIAQAYFHRDAWFRAIYAGDEPVGFVMLSDTSLLAEPPAEHAVFLWRLMVDVRHKRQGHGRAALKLVIEHLRRTHPALRRLGVSCVPGPGTPRPFYESIGFVATGEVDDGEEVLVLVL